MFLSKRNNGFYYIFYDTPQGKRTCISTKSKVKSEANQFFSNFHSELKERRKYKVIPITLRDFRFQFLKYSESIHTCKTTKAFTCSFNAIENYLGNIPLIEITTQKLMIFFQERIINTSIYAARKDYINLSSSFTKAIQDGYLKDNPCKTIKRFKIPEKQPLFFAEPEYQILLNAIDDKLVKDMVIVAANTGLRQMEILKLEWSQINFRDKFLILDNRNHLTKSKKIRTIPLNINSMQVLIEREREKNNNLVFNRDGQLIKQEIFCQTFKKYIIKSKLNPKLNFHSLRHTFASWLVQKGVSIYEVSKLLGHSDLKVTEIYAHLSPENLRNAVELLN